MTPQTNLVRPKEPFDIRIVRGLLNHWPFPRGKGVLARVFAPIWEEREFLLSVEPDVFVPAALDDYMVYWVFVNGYRSDAAVRLSRELIQPGDTVLDVGANIGLWAMGAARAAGDHGSVHAIEPVPENYSRLVANLELNRLENVSTSRLAFSDRAGTFTMFRPSYNNSGHPSLGKRDGVDVPFDVEAVTLDGYCANVGVERVDFLKIDVEGAEHLVLGGATRTLSAPHAPKILFEVNEETAAKLGTTTAEAKGLLRANGYRLFELDRGKLLEVDADRKERPGDLFAFLPDHIRQSPMLAKLGASATP